MAKEKNGKKWTPGKIVACILTIVVFCVLVYWFFWGKSSRGLSYELESSSYALILGEEDGKAYEVSGCSNWFDSKKKMVIPAEKKGKPVIGIGERAFDELKTREFIIEEDSKLIYIEKRAFNSCSKLEKINLPDSLMRIDTEAFRYCRLLKTIEYEGTMVQWESIIKGSDWNYAMPEAKVICSDGEITIPAGNIY